MNAVVRCRRLYSTFVGQTLKSDWVEETSVIITSQSGSSSGLNGVRPEMRIIRYSFCDIFHVKYMNNAYFLSLPFILNLNKGTSKSAHVIISQVAQVNWFVFVLFATKMSAVARKNEEYPLFLSHMPARK